MPSPAGDSCVCAPGREEVDSGFVDGVAVQVCAAPQAPPTCQGPYQILDQQQNACVWNCHQSTQPDPASGQCVCLPGTAEAGFLNDGRRYCLGTGGGGDRPAQQERYRLRAGQLFPAAGAAGFTMTVQTEGYGGDSCQMLENGTMVVYQLTSAPPSLVPRVCTVTVFGGRGLARGWRYEDHSMTVLEGFARPAGLTGRLPFQVEVIIMPHESRSVIRFDSVDLIGPRGQNWQAALQ